MNWLLIAVLIFLLICIIHGYRAGFIRLSVSLVFLILTIGISRMVTPYMTDFLEDYTPVYDSIKDSVIDKFREDAGEYNEELKTDQVRAIESSRLPGKIKDALIENNNMDVYTILDATGFDDYVGAYVARLLTGILAFVIAFLVIFILLKILVWALDLVSHLPLLNGANKIAGMLLGGVQGLIFVWIFFLLVTIFGNGSNGTAIMELVNSSLILSFLYSNNYLLLIVGSLVL